MALLAEEIVEEWLNRQGYFTIRGVKVGVHEIDLLAVKWQKDGKAECRHIEVQAVQADRILTHPADSILTQDG